LEIHELTLLLHDRRLEALQGVAPRAAGLDLAPRPAQIPFLAGDLLEEVRTRHARLVHGERHDAALAGAHFVDEPADAVAQRPDLPRREADFHHLAAHRVAR